MRAAVYDNKGAARDVLNIVERPVPEPGLNEVRVKIAVSGLNPTDIKARKLPPGQIAAKVPLTTPHRDGAGIIDKVGPGVAADRVGERVWLSQLDRTMTLGTAADYALVPANLAWRLPDGTTFAEGACLPIPALTAYCALFRDELIRGKTVLVHGGAGAVGFYAVQLARWGGAGKIIATVSREEQAVKAKAAGADTVINYRTGDVLQQIEAAAGGPNGVHHVVEVNFGANVALDAALIARNGTLAAYGSDAEANPNIPFSAFMQKDVLIRAAILYETPRKLISRAAAEINGLLEKKALRHQIAARFPLDRIVDAHEMQESGTTIGKILVDIAELD